MGEIPPVFRWQDSLVRTPSPGATKVTVDTWQYEVCELHARRGWTPYFHGLIIGVPLGLFHPYKWRDSTLLITGRGPTFLVVFLYLVDTVDGSEIWLTRLSMKTLTKMGYSPYQLVSRIYL